MFVSVYFLFSLSVAHTDSFTTFVSNLMAPFICNSSSLHYTSNHEATVGPHPAQQPIQTGNSYANLVLEVESLKLMYWKHADIKH